MHSPSPFHHAYAASQDRSAMITGSAFDHLCGVHTYGYLHSLMTAVSTSPLPPHAYIEVHPLFLMTVVIPFCSMHIQSSASPHDCSHPFFSTHIQRSAVISLAAFIYRGSHFLMTVVITFAARIYRDPQSSLLQHSYTEVRFSSLP